MSSLTPSDEMRLREWGWADTRAGRRLAARLALPVAGALVLGLAALTNTPGGPALDSSTLGLSLAQRVRWVRRGHALRLSLWLAGESGPPRGPNAAALRADASCAWPGLGLRIELADSVLLGLTPWEGPNKPYHPVPATCRAARIRTSQGNLTLIGEPADLACVAVVAGWASPDRV